MQRPPSRTTLATATLAVAVAMALPATAAPIVLFDQAFNIDGSLTTGTAPATVNTTGFDTDRGLGVITLALRGAGQHQVSLFVDHEIDETINTFFNETATSHGTVAAGQHWEIDEPGYVFGDIMANLIAGRLDNSNAFTGGLRDDVSMALGWRFALAGDEQADIRFLLSTQAPASGFYLTQTDDDSGLALHFSSTLQIRQSGGQVPEPASLALVALGLLAQWQARRQRAGR